MTREQIEGAQRASETLQRQYNQDKAKQKKKKGGLGTWIVVLLVFLLPRLFDLIDEVNGAGFYRVRMNVRIFVRRLEIRLGLNRLASRLTMQFGFDPLPWIVILLVIVLLVWAVKAGKKRKREKPDEVRSDRTGRVSAAVQRRDPRAKSFTQPDPYCVVCDQTGDDHFRHDKTQRIRQLDEWLKNGLIDREEYRVLMSRYERDL